MQISTELLKPVSVFPACWRRGYQYAMSGKIQEVVAGFIAFSVGINKCKNIVGVVRYHGCVLWRAHTITINNEDLAEHILEHN